jgi:hypothetical protein
MAVISKGIKLSYKGAEGAQFVELTNLQEIPELGGDKEAIEITTLADAAHTYTDGLLNYGDNLAFKFLYAKEQFTTLQDLTATQIWKVELPDATACTFGGTCSVKLDGVGTNAALTYTLSIKPNTEMTWQ